MIALIENGADPCARTEDGATPLHISAAKGDIEACRLLLHHGAGGKRQSSSSVTTTSSLRRDGEGKTALIVASIHGHAEVVRFLLEEGGAQIQDTDCRKVQDFERGKFSSAGGNALHHAAEHGRLAVVKVLLEYCEKHGMLEQMVDAPTQTGRAITPLCVLLNQLCIGLSAVVLDQSLTVCSSASISMDDHHLLVHTHIDVIATV
jgi:ankyrin repeat protein|eukprot:COSAG02_NODE_807_length_16930_cov_21.113719_2_plen_205_part_00